MKEKKKTNAQPLEELKRLRQRVAELEQAETERKQAEEMLRETRDYLENLINYANAPIIVWDPEFRITRFNRAFEHLTGYKADEVISQEVAMLFPEANREESLHKIARTLSGEYWESIEIPILRKDGETRLALWNSANIYAEDGKTLLAIIAQGTDITERERAEEALRESQEHAQFLADVLERSSQPFAVGYPDGQLMTYNTAYCKLLGYSKEELHELQWLTDLTPPEWREVVAKAAEEMGRTGQPQHFEKEYIRKDGSRVPVEVFAHPIFDSKGNIQYFYSFFTDITERKRIEHNLKESENKFRGIAERSFDLIFTTDKGGYLTYVSPAAEKIFYFKPEEMVGKHFKNFLVESEIPRVFQRFSENLEGKNLGVFSMEAIRKDGSHIFAELNSSPILENGEIVGMQGAIRDITERKQVEEALRESEKKYRTLMEEAPIGICHVDIKGKITYVNKTILQGTGYSSEELIGKNAFRLGLIPHETLKLLGGRMKEKLMGKPPSPLEIQFKRKDGKWIWLEIRGRLLSKHGVPVGIQIIGEDITERKRTEKALKDSEERYRGLFENSSEFLFTLDLRGNFTNVNKAAVELTGHTKAALLKMNFKDYTPRNNHRNLFRAFYNVFKTGKSLKDFSVKAIIEDKTVKYFEISVSPLKKGDEIIGFQGTSKDITERKRAEEELRQSLERLQKTLEGTVHALASAVEMRDPYTAGHQRRVTELACAVAEEMGLSEEQIEGLRMATLIHDIGKINVPAEILSKPTHLTDIEFDLVKIHPQTGYDILKGIEFPWSVAQIVLQHHERLDGSGYPTGLKGDEILLESRILGVADVVEAMSCHRPYRPARGLEKALEEIAQNKGKLYDSKVVDACLRLFAEGRFTFEDTKDGWCGGGIVHGS
ncbi:PAS domain S-box protein [Candidatus Bipolaricaulota bacterium]|nr:PAS domain S-box protein [Candidatus Bipolaricaulota bacterium]